ncbi:MAG: hypothetical protein A2660_00775 [Candidatus Doudnabacteria bacterium RIFCSPHIGHO2_01_FULL_45_18]|uniref:Cohesin domain-containing protein n=1 Tax=Candidatus Doudnabacteria bacterium RIFCSPHIGHO2_01_FULL_45_18 TaxID=1817823 RepID=A0A1F5NSR3_9BACT|nr:MAG: hypothetical protein A2660_00775 [Candidatus Doudnabacteria bacterium RIFCSPHIGHO2_01_FULL_45_18]
MPETNNKKAVNKNSNELAWYNKWHDSRHHVLTHWLILAVIVVFAWALLYNKINDWISIFSEPEIQVRISQGQANLSLDPQQATVTVGDIFSVDVVLDTGDKPVDGVDIYSMHYDPSILQVLDDNPAKAGKQILSGKILEINAANIVEEKTGSIKFAQVSDFGTNFTGRGILATIHFKALNPGTAYLKFDFTKGSTIDSNAAYRGKDQLSRVVDAIFTVNSK